MIQKEFACHMDKFFKGTNIASILQVKKRQLLKSVLFHLICLLFFKNDFHVSKKT